MPNISSTSALAKERAKSAELKARVCILEKKQALQNQVERLQLEEELAAAQARESVFAQMAQDEYSIKSHKTQLSEVTQYLLQPKLSETSKITADYKVSKDSKTVITNARPRERETVNTTATKTVITSRGEHNNGLLVDNDHDNLSSNELVKLEFRPLPGDRKELRNKTDVNQQSVLACMALMVEQHFSGDPIEYSTFIRGFGSQIERRLSSNDTRLRYLEQYLESELKDLIKGCFHVDANKGYFEAKRLLQEKYGDPYKISNAYLKPAAHERNLLS